MGTRRPLAQIIAIILFVLSTTCCLCGGLISVATIAPLPGDQVLLPNGEVATSELLSAIVVVTLCLTLTVALTILLTGLAVWFTFGREQKPSNIWARTTAVFLFVGSVFFGLWGVLVATTGILTGGMMITGEQIGAFYSVLASFACCVPAVVLGCASIAIWVFFIRKKQPSTFAINRQQTDAQSTAAYLTFMQEMLQQGKFEYADTDASVQARTLLTLNGANVIEKAKILTFLYNAGLILGDKPQISLKGVDFSHLDLSDINLTGINLTGANLSHADLHKTNLAGANLKKVIFYSADLRFVNLKEANLEKADLQEAKLHESQLCQANLQEANLSQANCWRVDFTEAKVTNEQLTSTKSLVEAVRPDGTKA